MSSYNVRYVSPLRSLERNVKVDNAKLREKIAQRRSILNQCDQKLRTLEAFRDSTENESPSTSPPRRHTISETVRDRYSSPLIHNFNDDSFQSISRKRERKEAAEMRLKGLFSRSLKPEYDDPGMVSKSLSFTTTTTASTISSDDKSSVVSFSKGFDNDSLGDEDGFEIIQSSDKKVRVLSFLCSF